MRLDKVLKVKQFTVEAGPFVSNIQSPSLVAFMCLIFENEQDCNIGLTFVVMSL